MAEESIDAGDEPRGRLDGRDVESLHQRPTLPGHVPSVAEPVVVMVDL